MTSWVVVNKISAIRALYFNLAPGAGKSNLWVSSNPLVSDAGRLFEVKKSAGAVKEAQFREFLRISEKTGSPMTFIFKEKPATGDIERLQRWAVDELGETEDILIKIVHVLD